MVTIVDNEALGREKGASNYLVKPIDRDRLALALEKHRVVHGDAENLELSHSGKQ